MSKKQLVVKQAAQILAVADNFQVLDEPDAGGTSLKGYFTANYQELKALLGEPMECDGYKVSGEWYLTDSEGNMYTIYDWKSTELYDQDYPTVEEFRDQVSAEFHIGGDTKSSPIKLYNALKSSGINVSNFRTK